MSHLLSYSSIGQIQDLALNFLAGNGRLLAGLVSDSEP
jgi:hypothetical protein